jgi:hypothetical protein
MSTIEMDEELNLRHRRFAGAKAGRKIYALVAALVVAAALAGCAAFQSSDPAVAGPTYRR